MKEKNDIAAKPLDAGRRIAARSVLCCALADGSSVMDRLSGTGFRYLLDGTFTPADWWTSFKAWHQRPRKTGDPNAEMRKDIEWACACALMCAVGAPVPGLDPSTESINCLERADRLAGELSELEEKGDEKTKQQVEIRNLVMARKKTKAIQRIIGILNEFEEISDDLAEYHRLQSDVISVLKIMYRVKDEPSDTKGGQG